MERVELKRCVREVAGLEERGNYFFLTDPHWGELERSSLAQVLKAAEEKPQAPDAPGWLCIPTGGTSGGLRFAMHDEQTLSAAVHGFCAFFGLEQVNAVDVLPPYHVSGLMARVRCAATGGRHVAGDWRRLEAGERPLLDVRAGPWVISLVPTQLQRLLDAPGGADWLHSFRLIFVGGGPTWPDLATAAADAGLPVVLTYGMTETAAMIAAVLPQNFVRGERQLATPLPHATLSLSTEGTLMVAGESVFRGYFPVKRATRSFETDDLGRMDEQGRLEVLGRKDAVIITGGKKVQPVEVEAALQATGQFVDVAVLGVPDPEWGESVVACFPTSDTAEPDWTIVEEGLAGSLAAYKRPKRYIAIRGWPRNSQGKLSRAELARRIAAELGGATNAGTR